MDRLDKIQSIYEMFNKLDNSQKTGLILSIIFLIASCSIWYWVFFDNGALKWVRGIREYHKNIKFELNDRSLFYRPTLYKIAITTIALASAYGVYLSVVKILNQ